MMKSSILMRRRLHSLIVNNKEKNFINNKSPLLLSLSSLSFHQQQKQKQIRSFSSSSSPAKEEIKNADNPENFVHGLTKEILMTNPIAEEYFRINYPDNPDFDEDGDHLLDEYLGPYYEKLKKDQEDERIRKENEPDPIIHELKISNELSKLNIRPLICYKRNPNRYEENNGEKGTRRTRYMRREYNMLPGLIYGNDPTRNIGGPGNKMVDTQILIKIDWKYIQRELNRYHYRDFTLGRVYELTTYVSKDSYDEYVDKQLVIPTHLQMHPIKNKYYCCNFIRYYPGRPIKIPISYINEEKSQAMKSGRGGFIAHVATGKHIEVIIPNINTPIPETIQLDCTDLKVKDVVRGNRLIFPNGVIPSPRLVKKLSKNKNNDQRTIDTYLIGTVFGNKRLMGLDAARGGGGSGDNDSSSSSSGDSTAAGGSGGGDDKKST